MKHCYAQPTCCSLALRCLMYSSIILLPSAITEPWPGYNTEGDNLNNFLRELMYVYRSSNTLTVGINMNINNYHNHITVDPWPRIQSPVKMAFSSSNSNEM